MSEGRYLFKCPRCSRTWDTFLDVVRYLLPPEEVVRLDAQKIRERHLAGYERAKHMHVQDECIGVEPAADLRRPTLMDLLSEERARREGRMQ